MALFKITCDLYIDSNNEADASNQVYDVINHAVNNYTGWASYSINVVDKFEEEEV